MHIALTYDLKSDYLASGVAPEDAAEFDSEDTVAAIEAALARLGHTPVRIGRFESLLGRLAGGERWPLVFNFAEGFRGSAREAQIPSLLEAVDVPCVFSSALAMALCLHKGLTNDVLAAAGLAVPPRVVVDSPDFDSAATALPFPVFAKPACEGTGKGIAESGRAEGPEELAGVVRQLLRKYRQPVIVEPFLSGREFTVGIVGTGPAARVLGVMEVSFLAAAPAAGDAAATAASAPAVYSYAAKADYRRRVAYRLARDAEAAAAGRLALAGFRRLGLRDCARVDLRSDAAARPHWMEVNTLPGLHPVDSDLPILAGLAGIPFSDLIAMILASAMERLR